MCVCVGRRRWIFIVYVVFFERIFVRNGAGRDLTYAVETDTSFWEVGAVGVVGAVGEPWRKTYTHVPSSSRSPPLLSSTTGTSDTAAAAVLAEPEPALETELFPEANPRANAAATIG